MLVLAGLAGCSGFDITEPIASLNRATGTKVRPEIPPKFGVVAADDPAAVSVANSILLQGGSAADAAAAMGFALGVTLPSRAGLGGGGVCLVGGGKAGDVQTLDFIPPPGTGKGERTDRPTAVPTMVRGLTALHARYGRLPWGTVLAPAQTFAGDGHAVTKVFAGDLAEFAGPLFADPVAKSAFAGADGTTPEVGTRLRQFDLRVVLAQIARRGAGEFYNGVLARRLVQAVEEAGGSLTAGDLRNYLPVWRGAYAFDVGDSVLHVPLPPASAGIAALQMFQMMLVDNAWLGAPADERAHLQIEAAKRAFADRSRWLGPGYSVRIDIAGRLTLDAARQLMSDFSPSAATPPDSLFAPGSTVVPEADAETSFVVVDGQGLAVACTLTMYNMFGTGRMAPGLGIMLAAAPGEGTRNPLSLGPVVVTRKKDNAFRFAFAASGGATAGPSMASVMLQTLLAKDSLRSAMAAPRVHYSVPQQAAIIEDLEAKERVVSLITRGHAIKRLPTIGRVNGVACPDGLPAAAPNCAVEADPRGAGLSVLVNLAPEG